MHSSSTYKRKCFWILVTILVYILKIFGLAPFAVGTRNKSFKTLVDNRSTLHDHGSIIFLISKTGLAYNISLVVVIPVTVVLQLPQLFSMNNEFESPVTEGINIVQGILCVFTFWVIVISWTLTQTGATCVINKLLEVRVILDSLTKKQLFDQNFDKNKMFCSIAHVIINCSLWITICVNESMQSVISDAFINWFFFTVPSFVIFWFIVQYYIAVRLVVGTLKGVNMNLSNFVKEFCQGEPWPSSSVILNESRTHATTLRNCLENSGSRRSQLDTVNSIRNIRTTIEELSQDISEFFSFPILLCVAYSFFSLVYNVFYLVTRAIVKKGDSSVTGTLTTIAWIFISIYPLILLFSNVSKTTTEAKLTGRIVHRLLAANMRKEIKTELEQFSLQLLHENISFTACGFFELDFTLLHLMLGATTTYLVILIQFQQ